MRFEACPHSQKRLLRVARKFAPNGTQIVIAVSWFNSQLYHHLANLQKLIEDLGLNRDSLGPEAKWVYPVFSPRNLNPGVNG